MTKKVSSGVKALDQFLEGGYETDAITTLYGPAGSGKTNFAMLAALEVAKQGKKVIFVDTEGGFSHGRLKQLIPDSKKVMENIIFLRPMNFEEQKQAITKLKDLINGKIGLIIVDTMTMLYRLQRSFKEEDYNRDLSLQMVALNEIARKHQIPVLLTSQVYSSFENGIRIVGGDILSYISKCLVELEPNQNNKRKMVLKKHRSIASDRVANFQIVNEGIIPL